MDGNPNETATGAPLKRTPLHPQVRFLLATLFVNAVCFGIIVPVTPSLVMELGARDLQHATVLGGWLAISFAAVQFVFSPVMGNLSDAWGRRPILLFSLAGFAVEFWLMALAPGLVWLFVARIFSGVSGASNAPAQSSIADLAAPDERGRLFGLLGAAFGMGFVIGPALGGLLGELGPRIPFFAAAVLVSVNFLTGLVLCRETLPAADRRRFEWRRANPVGAFVQARYLSGMGGLAAVYLLWQLASLVYPLIWSWFAMARWQWSPAEIGLSLVVVGMGMAAVNIWLAPRLLRRWGERRTAVAGIGAGGLAMAGFAFAQETWAAYALVPVMALQSLAHPALTAMFSRRASATNQGEVQGFASALMAMGSLIAPILYFPMQNWLAGGQAPIRFDGGAMLSAAIVALIAVVVLGMDRSGQVDRSPVNSRSD